MSTTTPRGGGAGGRPPARRAGRLGWFHRSALASFGAGVTVVFALAAVAWSSHESSEDRILQRRAAEAGAVLSTGAMDLQERLVASAQVAEATSGDVEDFTTFVATSTGESGPFASVTLWARDGDQPRELARAGQEPTLAAVTEDLLGDLDPGPGLRVVDLLHADPPALGLVHAVEGDPRDLVVYAEVPVPAGTAPVEQTDSAFADLQIALYLDEERPDELVLTNHDELPLGGRRATHPIEFADHRLVLVVSSTGLLGSSLSAVLPWLIIGAGVLLALVFAGLNERALRRRDEAAGLALEVARIAEENARLYSEQRSVAQTLQQSLLLERLPEVPGLELAARYQVGAAGVDIGGDWYDVIPRGDGCVLVAVGDVSGRGIRAATVMAKLRYSIQAYAAEGQPVAEILTRLSHLVSVAEGGHFATVVLLEVDPARRSITGVSAGHPRPLVLAGGRCGPLEVPPGVPVGVVREPSYEAVHHDLAPGATVLAFTDGLFERRGETVDDGLERLRSEVAAADGRPLEGLLDHLIDRLTGSAADDAAIIAVRWPTTTNPS